MDDQTSVIVGPLTVDVGLPADEVFSAMEALASSGEAPTPKDLSAPVVEGVPEASQESVREYTTPIRLPLGIRFTARTREAVRSIPPNEIQFRHLSGPVRGHVERIVVEPIDEWRSQVTYRGSLPPSGPFLRIIHQTVARPAIERVVRSHMSTLEERIKASREQGADDVIVEPNGRATPSPGSQGSVAGVR